MAVHIYTGLNEILEKLGLPTILKTIPLYSRVHVGYDKPDNREEWLAAYWRRKDLLDELNSPYRLSELQKRREENRDLVWYYDNVWGEDFYDENPREAVKYHLHMQSKHHEWCITLASDQKTIECIQIWYEHWPEDLDAYECEEFDYGE